MQLIDGIGDEVVHFAAAVVVMLVAALAWWSTNARMDRYRTILMRHRADHPVTLSIRTSAAPLTMLYNNRQSTAAGQPATETVSASVTSTVAAVSSGPSNSSDDVVPLQEMDSIVDADMALLENNRLHFYRRINSPRTAQIATESATDTETDSQEDSEPASNAQIREMDSIVSAMEADETSNCDVFSRPQGNEPNPTTLINRCQTEQKDKDPQTNSSTEDTATNAEGDVTDNTEANERKILIRLKYLNDTLKEVEGSLDELLKDFKWRHFSSELSAESRVRLIFNGRVLCDEGATLRALGLHHRAVVHCLVHPNRSLPQRTPPEEAGGLARVEGAGGARAPPERAWDLENILMTLVSVALTVVWFFRCEYSNMFTASASVALFGLTVFYSVAIFGLYLSDTFHMERPRLPRRPQPAPNN